VVVCEDGERYGGDVVVGCDGVNSIVRSEMWRICEEEMPGSLEIEKDKKCWFLSIFSTFPFFLLFFKFCCLFILIRNNRSQSRIPRSLRRLRPRPGPRRKRHNAHGRSQRRTLLLVHRQTGTSILVSCRKTPKSCVGPQCA